MKYFTNIMQKFNSLITQSLSGLAIPKMMSNMEHDTYIFNTDCNQSKKLPHKDLVKLQLYKKCSIESDNPQ